MLLNFGLVYFVILLTIENANTANVFVNDGRCQRQRIIVDHTSCFNRATFLTACDHNPVPVAIHFGFRFDVVVFIVCSFCLVRRSIVSLSLTFMFCCALDCIRLGSRHYSGWKGNIDCGFIREGKHNCWRQFRCDFPLCPAHALIN